MELTSKSFLYVYSYSWFTILNEHISSSLASNLMIEKSSSSNVAFVLLINALIQQFRINDVEFVPLHCFWRYVKFKNICSIRNQYELCSSISVFLVGICQTIKNLQLLKIILHFVWTHIFTDFSWHCLSLLRKNIFYFTFTLWDLISCQLQ